MLEAALAFIAGLWVLRGAVLLVSIRVVPTLPPASGAPRPGRRVAIVVPARNEERDVGPATRSKLGSDEPDRLVVVVDDRSTDRTREILRTLESEYPDRLRIVDGVEPRPEWLGKPHALWEGVEASGAGPDDWLAISDADVYYRADLVSRALDYAEREGADFVTLLPVPEMKTFGEKLFLPTLPLAAFCYAPGFLANVDRFRAIGAGGGIFNLLRRRTYDAVGGFEALKDSVIDDIQLGRRVKRAGFRCRMLIERDAIRIRMYHGFGEIVRGLEKNGYYGIGGNVPTAALVLLLFTVESLLPWAALAAGLAGLAPGPGSLAFGLAATGVGLTIAVREGLAAWFGLPRGWSLLHPVFAVAMVLVFGRSAWVNGVLGRNVWRGRARAARGLRA